MNTDMAEALIDQAPLATSVAEKIPYSFRDYFLVKELEPVKIKKEFSTPIPKSKRPKKDENGISAVEYDDVKTEIKEVDSDYGLGVVLKLPYNYVAFQDPTRPPFQIGVGDVIVYPVRSRRIFDLISGSALIATFDIVGTKEVTRDGDE